MRKDFVKRAAVAYFAALAVLAALLFFACALPSAPVNRSLARSVATLRAEGLYPDYLGCKLLQMDNYTDTIMLFEAAAVGESAPLDAMMTNTTYNVDNFETMYDDLARYLEGDTAGLTAFSYARYWHGYLIWLRPLLALGIPYGGVRVFQYFVLAALFFAVLWRLRRVCGVRAAWWFAVSQLAVTVVLVPRQIQYFTTFAIAYAGCAWVLAKPRKSDSLCVGLVVVGVCTAFLDLLVTPVITLCLPLTCWLLRPEQRLRGGVPQCAAVLAGGLCWGGGYGLCWATKWVAASVVTGQDIIGDALHQIGVRTAADTWHGMELTWGNIIQFVYSTLAERGLLLPLLLVVLLGAAAFALSLRGAQAAKRALPLLLTALLPVAWLCALRTHSIQHGWYTWRVLGAVLFAGTAFLYYSCSLKTGVRKIFAKKD